MKGIKAVLTGVIKHDNLKVTHCALPISMGQSYCQGEKFEASLRLALKKFGKVSVIIADSCHAFTIAQERHLSLSEAYLQLESLRAEGKQLGDNWLTLHRPIIQSVEQELGLAPGTVGIARWDEVIMHSEFPQAFNALWTRFNSKADSFFQTVNKSTGQFFARHRRAQDTFSFENEIVQLSSRYIVEEAAVAKVWKKVEVNGRKINYLAYAGSVNEAIKHVLKESDYKENAQEDINLLLFRFERPKTELRDEGEVSSASHAASHSRSSSSGSDSSPPNSSPKMILSSKPNGNPPTATTRPVLHSMSNGAKPVAEGDFMQKILYMQLQQLSTQVDQLTILASSMPESNKKNIILTEIEIIRAAQTAAQTRIMQSEESSSESPVSDYLERLPDSPDKKSSLLEIA